MFDFQTHLIQITRGKNILSKLHISLGVHNIDPDRHCVGYVPSGWCMIAGRWYFKGLLPHSNCQAKRQID